MNQNITVLVIAQNEEKYIKKCLQSLIDQTVKPSKIFVVVHNSKDHTRGIAREFASLHLESSIKIISYPCAPEGIVYARLKALQYVEDEGHVLCIDGDSMAETTWVEKMSAALSRPGNIFVGSAVRVKGPIICWLLNLINKKSSTLYNKNARERIWDSSYGFHAPDKSKVRDFLQRSIPLKNKLGLEIVPEINILAKLMHLLNKNEELINSTYVTKYVDEKSSGEIFENMKNYRKSKLLLDLYFEKECGLT